MPRKGKATPIFYHGKNIKKSDSSRTPVRGEPNSYIDFYYKKSGKFHRRRKINSKGRAYKDMDMPDLFESEKHVHDYSENGKRGDPRNPNKKELREMQKASKKRRFWR